MLPTMFREGLAPGVSTANHHRVSMAHAGMSNESLMRVTI